MNGQTPPPIRGRTAAAIIDLLSRERLMTLAVNRPDGWPQATTVGYVNERLDLYFSVARTSQKFANLQVDPRASVAIRFHGPHVGDGVGLSMGGRVEEVVDADAAERIGRLLVERYPEAHVYCPSGDQAALLRFKPSVVSAVGVAGGRSDPETFSVGEG